MSSSSTASNLDDLIGLRGAKRIVNSLIRQKIQTHAILFYGGVGCGKEVLSHILAGLWLCNVPNETFGADGSCRACLARERNTNPDLLLIAPQGLGNMITIKQLQPRHDSEEQLLSMQEFLRSPPLVSRHKVVVISDADRMNSSTSNALLKTLEEPPSFAKLVLTTSSTSGIRPTILSRVLAIACSLPTDAEINRRFPDATEDDIKLAEHAPGRIAAILKNPEPYRDLLAFSKDLPKRRKYEALLVSENLRTLAEKFNAKLDYGMRSANAEVARTLGLIFSRDSTYPSHWGENLVEAHERILANGNATLVFDTLFARILPL